MAIRGPLVPSNYPSQLEQPSGILQSVSRQPLTESPGNSQLQILAQGNLYHDNKEHHHQSERAMYAIPAVVPSLPSPRQSIGHTWEQRRQRCRRSRQQRYSRNPLADSPHYLAYRARQNRDGNPEDAKWPEVLEMAFLDGRCFIQVAQ
jgi:transcriptional enhancer factor